MSTVVIDDVAMAFGARDILRGVSAELPQGARVGLVGPNGAGKSTLMKIIAGLEEPVRGTVHRAQGDRFAYVAQEPLLVAGRSVFEEALASRAELLDLERALAIAGEEFAEAGPEESDAARDRYADLEARFEHAGGYTFEARAKRVLHALGLTEPFWPRQAGDLSGGERARLGLAQALLQEPDVMLLDEPTNHLDMETLGWLEELLLEQRGTLIVVSHDRYFLDRVATTIWEIRDGGLTVFSGNYSAYDVQRQERDARQAIEHERQQAEIARQEDFIRRYGAGQRAKEAHGRQLRLDRLERIAPVSQAATLSIKAGTVIRAGQVVVRLTDLAVAHPADPSTAILRAPRQLEIQRGERVAIVGPNGAGKTTLLRTIMGELAPLSGEARFGASVSTAFYRQAAEELDPDDTVIESLMEASGLYLAQARDLAARFLFRGENVFERIGDLSGGERGRLSLARLFSRGANLLVLDEPTNHLDLPSREALEAALKEYHGSLLFVSHDRRFIDVVATKLWLVRDGAISMFEGGWSAYQQFRQSNAASAPSDSARQEASTNASVAPAPLRPEPARREPVRNGGRSSSREDRRREARVREMERLVAEAEAEVARLHEQLESASIAAQVSRLPDLAARHAAAETYLSQLLSEWELAATEAS